MSRGAAPFATLGAGRRATTAGATIRALRSGRNCVVDLTAMAPQLVEEAPGYWVAPVQMTVAYPETGHQNLMDVEDTSFWFAHRSAAIASIAQRFPPQGCIFDVGGGNGHVTRKFRSVGLESIVVEPGDAGARAALARGLGPVINGTTEAAGFLPGSLPAIGLFDVLEHLDDDFGLLTHLHRLLQPGGRLYVTVPAYQWLWSVDDVRAQHFRRYTTKTLRKVMEKAGFAVEYDSYLFRVLPLPILLMRVVPSRLGRRSEEGSRSGEHAIPGGVAGRVFSWTLDRELRRLSNGRVGFGSSVLMVASKDR